MEFVSRKKRSTEEVDEILKEFSECRSVSEVSLKFGISESAFYRLLKVSRGEAPCSSKKAQQTKLKKLEKLLLERDKEIALLKSALKKS
jgi:AraC-like DNA-binding protein